MGWKFTHTLMRRNSFLNLKRLCPILLQGSMAIFICQCAPQSITKDGQGLEILPNPRLEGFPPSSSEMVGKSFIGGKALTSDGEVAKVMQFHESGKLSTYDVDLPEMTHSNSIHGIGFYSVRGNLVEIAEYDYDSGVPGYRYFRGVYEISGKGNELKQGQHAVWALTSTKFKITRKWKPAP